MKKNNLSKIISNILLLFTFLCLFSNTISAKNKFTSSADKDFKNHKYEIAIDKYKKALSKIKNDVEERNRINYQLAECYRLTNNYRSALNQYKRLIRAKYQEKNPHIILQYAENLKANNNHKEAKIQYINYLNFVHDDARARNGIIACDSVNKWLSNPTKHQIKNLSKINSRESDFAPAYGGRTYNTIIFTSTRKEATGKQKDEWTGQKFSDLFISRANRQGEWSKPVLLDNEDNDLDNTNTINSKANEGTPFLNKNFTRIYFTRCANKKGSTGCHIYTSKRIGRNWSKPQIVMLDTDSISIIGHPCLSNNELTIYFTSDRRGSIGGKDIWYATRKNKNGKFGRPKNLGSKINTKGDEAFPFIRNDSLLYFSSNGHISIGGMDIFVSRKSKGGNWSPPENLKSPINSYRDDFGIVFHKENEEGFFSSNRKGAKGDDIYSFIIPAIKFSIKGNITNRENQQALSDVKIKLHGSDGSVTNTLSNKDGFYSFNSSQVNKNIDYEINISLDDYFKTTDKLSTFDFKESQEFELNYQLQQIPEEPIVLPDILYDLGKWDLKPQYQDSLQGLIKTLEENKNIVIELASHTDSRDTEERNNILSLKRATSVIDYLILRGINPNRLVPKGYGEQKPRELKKEFILEGVKFKEGSLLNETFIDQLENNAIKEIAHQLNRRTEFSVLRTNFNPIKENQNLEDKLFKSTQKTTPFYKDKITGEINAQCNLNGKSFTFIYKEDIDDAEIPLRETLVLLNNGVIEKEDFPDENSLSNGTIANGSEFYINKFKIANKTIRNIRIRVNNRIKDKLILGESTLILFGLFNFDTENKIIIFK
jgi:peptidoglycan-associated lipoprotein